MTWRYVVEEQDCFWPVLSIGLTIEQIESTNFINAYDFKSALKDILRANPPHEYISADGTCETRLYQILGRINLACAERDTKAFIRKLASLYEPAPSQTHASDARNHPAHADVTLQHGGQLDEPLQVYTSALHEYGQKQSRSIQKEVKQKEFDPITFEAIWVFGEHRGRGVGRSKKLAGHLAAKDLCQRLGIDPFEMSRSLI